ncbi:SUMF1/EgtB/PvdO family nonheme iron enzyme [Bacillaceae bacterium IKA-2]|nr:SUMF1/EgtB/PvdO family nonheme iron enzyme [Bacillaceae bacterium IKA-2]
MPFILSMKDTYRQAVEAATGGKNTVMYDDKGNPSIMVCVNKQNYADIITGGASTPFPAFIVNGQVKNEFWMSKFQNIVHDGRAYSIPGVDARTSITYDQSKAACEAKGAGWHLATNPEWAVIAEWAKKNGSMPRGNNNYGKDIAAPYETGRKAGTSDRVLTGSGPASWSHDGTNDGIFDLNGNIWEWVQGYKIVDGIAHVMVDNNFGDAESLWINTGVNVTTGMTSGHKILTLKEGVIPNSPGMLWEGLAIPATADATGASAYGNDGYYFNALGERFPNRGGHWTTGAIAGVFALNLFYERSFSSSYRGFRSAFISSI